MRLRLNFPNGLPAFESHRYFRLEARDRLAPLVELRSEADELSFCLLPIALLDPAYELTLADADRAALAFEPPHELLALALVTLGEDSAPTANLLAPIVIDMATGRGVQAIRDDQRYSHQHPVGPQPADTEKICS